MAKATKTKKKTAPPKIMLEVHPDLYYLMQGAMEQMMKEAVFGLHSNSELLKNTKSKIERYHVKEVVEYYTKLIKQIEVMDKSFYGQYVEFIKFEQDSEEMIDD